MALERVAAHQTRLRTPGVALDARGIALGERGVVLLPSLDRLVTFLSLYTSQSSLGPFVPSLSIELLQSRLAAREVAFSFAAEGRERMDRVAEIARLAGGYTFTGTSRHFVQYRDASAPFGFDTSELLASDADLVLYHSSFSQTYTRQRALALPALLSRLALRSVPAADPSGAPPSAEAALRWIVAEPGLGGALVHYLVRSHIGAEVGLAEWPPPSALDDEPLRRYLFRAPNLPPRVARLVQSTPGLGLFEPVGPGVAVEVGWQHPVALRACPVFDPAGMVFFRGAGLPTLELTRAPALGDVRAFARVELRREEVTAERAGDAGEPSAAGVRVPVRLLPAVEPLGAITATRISSAELPLLRRLAYALSAAILRRARIALTELGAFVIDEDGIQSLPLGTFYRELSRRLYVPAGYAPAPAVAAEVLQASFGDTTGKVLFLELDGRALALDEGAFVPLETALLEGGSWAEAPALAIDAALAVTLPTIALESPGLRPMRDVELAEGDVGDVETA